MADRAALLATLRTAAAGLADVEEKKMFGCEALFTAGRVFAMVWKEGRIGVKLTDADKHAALLGHAGASPWSPGGKMTATSWVLVAPALHGAKKLMPWLQLAHAMATRDAKTKPKPKPKKTAAKKAAVVKKKTVAKKETVRAEK